MDDNRIPEATFAYTPKGKISLGVVDREDMYRRIDYDAFCMIQFGASFINKT